MWTHVSSLSRKRRIPAVLAFLTATCCISGVYTERSSTNPNVGRKSTCAEDRPGSGQQQNFKELADSDYGAIILTRLLRGTSAFSVPAPTDPPSPDPFPCLVVMVTDGDTVRCVPVVTDADVAGNIEVRQREALLPVKAALATPSKVYVNRSIRPQLQVSPWRGRCRRIDSCTLKIRIYAIDAPEMNKSFQRSSRKAALEAAQMSVDEEAENSKEAGEELSDEAQASSSPFDENEDGEPEEDEEDDKKALSYGSQELDEGGQALGVASAAALSDLVLGRVILLQPLQKDRYGRFISRILVPVAADRKTDSRHVFRRFLDAAVAPLQEKMKLKTPASTEKEGVSKPQPLLEYWEDLEPSVVVDVSDIQLERGLATLYTGRGRPHNRRETHMRDLQEEAAEDNRGLWSLDPSLVEDPAEYRRRSRQKKP